MNVMKFENARLNKSQPMWPMEEKARRGRISVCIRPPMPPTRAFKAASIGRREKLLMFSLKIHKGAIFCHVESQRAVAQLILAITEGYQLWKGDIPNFIIMAIKIVISGREFRRGPIRKIREA